MLPRFFDAAVATDAAIISRRDAAIARYFFRCYYDARLPCRDDAAITDERHFSP